MAAPRLLPLGLVGALLLGGCARSADPEELAAFCASASTLADGTVLEGVDLTALESVAPDDASVSAAADAVAALGSAPAPGEVDDEWQAVVAPLQDLLDELRDGAPTATEDRDRLRVVVDALVAPEVVEAGDAVDAYVAEHC